MRAMPWSRLPFGILAWGLALFVSPVQAEDANGTAADEQVLKAAKVGTDGANLLEFFRKRTRKEADEERIRKLIQQLGNESYDLREKASRELIESGAAARPHLMKASDDKNPEIARRAGECLEHIDEGPGAALPIAAARMLKLRKPSGAVEALLAYAPWADDENVAEEVRTALAGVALTDGKVDPLIVNALADPSSARRTAAGVALVRCGGDDHRPAVKKLLEDSDLTVRMRVGLALLAQKDKDAVPVLIDLLAKLPRDEIWLIEEMLYRIAQEKAPTIDAGDDERKKYRDAWAAWWKTNGDKLDLAKINLNAAHLGYTLVILLDAGKVLELDTAKKVRWQIDNVQFPLDAQMLPGERVLLAEHNGNVVTERNRDGKVLWKKEIEGPLMAQRLPNGRTFIASRERLLEVDKNGKETFTYSRPDGEAFMKAIKLANGDMAFITDAGQCVRINSAGKELKTFQVNLQTYGGRLEALPNGHIIVPQTPNNEVIEFDADGKPLWQAKFDQPVAAVRLPNGNTLVTSMSQQRAVEINKAGKPVWEYKTDTRVTRAFRR
jgi:HEAT repeat protein